MTDNNQSILLVEDNEVNRDMLVRRLQRAGHQVTTAGDGEAALEAMRQQQPAVVLMDMNLPIKDGWTACREAQQDASIAGIPIIALTAKATKKDREQSFAAGMDDFITKPFNETQLQQILDNYTH